MSGVKTDMAGLSMKQSQSLRGIGDTIAAYIVVVVGPTAQGAAACRFGLTGYLMGDIVTTACALPYQISLMA